VTIAGNCSAVSCPGSACAAETNVALNARVAPTASPSALIFRIMVSLQWLKKLDYRLMRTTSDLPLQAAFQSGGGV
jgi:hypothetical protein